MSRARSMRRVADRRGRRLRRKRTAAAKTASPSPRCSSAQGFAQRRRNSVITIVSSPNAAPRQLHHLSRRAERCSVSPAACRALTPLPRGSVHRAASIHYVTTRHSPRTRSADVRGSWSPQSALLHPQSPFLLTVPLAVRRTSSFATWDGAPMTRFLARLAGPDFAPCPAGQPAQAEDVAPAALPPADMDALARGAPGALVGTPDRLALARLTRQVPARDGARRSGRTACEPHRRGRLTACFSRVAATTRSDLRTLGLGPSPISGSAPNRASRPCRWSLVPPPSRPPDLNDDATGGTTSYRLRRVPYTRHSHSALHSPRAAPAASEPFAPFRGVGAVVAADLENPDLKLGPRSNRLDRRYVARPGAVACVNRGPRRGRQLKTGRRGEYDSSPLAVAVARRREMRAPSCVA